MDPLVQVVVAMIVCSAAVLVVKLVASTVLRMRELQRNPAPHLLEQRLERIEAAVDAIAIEVERAGELQRFTARLAEQPNAPDPPRLTHTITPH